MALKRKEEQRTNPSSISVCLNRLCQYALYPLTTFRTCCGYDMRNSFRNAQRCSSTVSPSTTYSRSVIYYVLQSDHVKHGLPTYMKGVRITKLRFEVIDKVFKALIRLTEDRPDITINCMIEYHSLLKICSVPNDATAFIRVPYPNTLNIFRWTEDTVENLNFVREVSKEITDILAKGNEGADIAKYGNYGVLFTETMNVNAD